MFLRTFEGLKMKDQVQIRYTNHAGVDHVVTGTIEWISDIADLISVKGDNGEECIFANETRKVVVLS